MITKIETTQTVNTVRETNIAMMDDWCEFLESELSEQYPDAEIAVHQDNRISSDTLYVEHDGGEVGSPTKADVQEFINRCWNKWC